MECPRCRAENRAGRRFCADCGVALHSACPACGFANQPGERFCGGCGTPLGRDTVPADAGARPEPALPRAERRQLTVVFSDLVGSTELAARLDPEEWREVVRDYHGACEDVIAGLDGHVAQYLGDGLLVYFGYPLAHEDDAQRAVRAGLGMVEAVDRLNRSGKHRSVRLAVRVGIHTGLVVVGEIGGPARPERLALGETPNVAARLQDVTEPNTVAISEATYRLVHRAFACLDLGTRWLKGVPRSVPVHRVLAEIPPATIGASRAARSTPLVGREEEVTVLLARWALARQGQGQVVLITGEPGIGKSRLVEAVADRVRGAPNVRLSARGSPYHAHTPLYPVLDLLASVLEWSRDDTPDTRLAKLEHVAARRAMCREEAVPLLGSLLGVPIPDRYPRLAMSPVLQKRRTLATVVDLFLAVAAEEPVLLLVEDLHWIDATTVELLNLLVERVSAARLLLLLTSRPPFQPPWAGRSPGDSLTLARLSPPETTFFGPTSRAPTAPTRCSTASIRRSERCRMRHAPCGRSAIRTRRSRSVTKQYRQLPA
jgi:class 3 adenylate cyclase